MERHIAVQCPMIGDKRPIEECYQCDNLYQVLNGVKIECVGNPKEKESNKIKVEDDVSDQRSLW